MKKFQHLFPVGITILVLAIVSIAAFYFFLLKPRVGTEQTIASSTTPTATTTTSGMEITQSVTTSTTTIYPYTTESSDNQYFSTAYESSHYKVYFNSSDEETARLLVQAGEDVYPVDIRIYGAGPPNKTMIYVFHSLENIRELEPTHVPPVASPDSSGGAFDTFPPLGDGLKAYNLIRAGTQVDAHLIGSLKSFIAHEGGHRYFWYLYPAIRKPVRPNWLDEGIAMYAGLEVYNGNTEYGFGVARQKISASGPVSLATLDQLQASGDTLELFYGESAAFIQYIVGRYGEQGLGNFLHNYNQSADLNDAFVKTFNMTESNFETQYSSNIQKLASQATSGTEFYLLLKNGS